MAKRSYHQYCSVARALDIVGGRWTLLIVRELLIGPKRYTDLLEGLPGIGTNLLSERLKHLEAHAVLAKRRLPPPAHAVVYELTAYGRGLEPAIVALGQWGMSQLGQPMPEDDFKPGWLVLAARITFRADEARGVQEAYELRVDNEVFRLEVDEGTLRTDQGHADNPDLILTTDADTFLAVASRQRDWQEAVDSGAIELTGDRDALRRFDRIFGLPEQQDAQPTSSRD